MYCIQRCPKPPREEIPPIAENNTSHSKQQEKTLGNHCIRRLWHGRAHNNSPGIPPHRNVEHVYSHTTKKIALKKKMFCIFLRTLKQVVTPKIALQVSPKSTRMPHKPKTETHHPRRTNSNLRVAPHHVHQQTLLPLVSQKFFFVW